MITVFLLSLRPSNVVGWFIALNIAFDQDTVIELGFKNFDNGFPRSNPAANYLIMDLINRLSTFYIRLFKFTVYLWLEEFYVLNRLILLLTSTVSSLKITAYRFFAHLNRIFSLNID